MSYIELRGITKRYREVYAVHSLDLNIEKGAFISLLGPSGCGKTTTLRMIAGFVEPTDGEIYINDTPVFSRKHSINILPEDRHIGMVFQSYAVWPHMTVFNNIAYPLKLRKMSRDDIAERVHNAIAMVNLSGYEKRYPNELSGGQQQRVSIARALVMEPSLLLLDEPLSSLDAKLREKMCHEIKAIWRRTGITIVYVTHDQKEAMALSDNIILMDRGNISQCGSPSEIYKTPANRFSADFIGKSNLFTGIAVFGEHIGILTEENVLIPVQSIAGVKEGEKCTFLARPEQVDLLPRNKSDETSPMSSGGLSGTITYCNYYGSFVEYGVDIGCGSEIRTEINPEIVFQPGDLVWVSVKNVLTINENGSD